MTLVTRVVPSRTESRTRRCRPRRKTARNVAGIGWLRAGAGFRVRRSRLRLLTARGRFCVTRQAPRGPVAERAAAVNDVGLRAAWFALLGCAPPPSSPPADRVPREL